MLKEHFDRNIKRYLISSYNITNIYLIPNINKIVLHSTGLIDPNLGLELISGQKGIITRARKSNAGFKIRKNQILGAKVTLRKQIMYNFLNRLVITILPNQAEWQPINIKKMYRGQKLNSCTIRINPNSFNPEMDTEILPCSDFKSVDINIAISGTKCSTEIAALLNCNQIPCLI